MCIHNQLAAMTYLSEQFTIHGAVPSKSNSYKIITISGHASLAKQPPLRRYERDFALQCPLRGEDLQRRFRLDIDVYFASDRNDLDNALKAVLDCLQGCQAIHNDRLCVEIHARKLVDKTNPRCVMAIIPME